MADTYMFEVYYETPIDRLREERSSATVAKHGGRLDFHEAGGALRQSNLEPQANT